MLRAIAVLWLASVHALRPSPLRHVPSADFVREAEKKHGRVALLAVPALATIAATTGENPVTFLSAQPVATQAGFFSACGAIEALTLARLGPKFTLRNGVTPGKFLPDDASVSDHADALETAAGRVAMLVAASWISVGAS